MAVLHFPHMAHTGVAAEGDRGDDAEVKSCLGKEGEVYGSCHDYNLPMWQRMWILHRLALVPAGIVLVGLGAAWICIHFSLMAGGSDEVRNNAFAGWVALLMLSSMVACIIWTAAADLPSAYGGEGRHVFLGYALVG